GLSPEADEIIQIAAIRIRDGRVRQDDAFSTYVRPHLRIDSFITYLTGITNRQVRHAPQLMTVLKTFSDYCENSLLLGNNIHRFDGPFLRSACQRLTSGRRLRYIDSMHLSWLIWGRAAGVSHSLDEVIRRLRVRRRGLRRHDARGDVVLLAHCIL